MKDTDQKNTPNQWKGITIPTPDPAATPSDLLFVTMLVQGLLSTGHYTKPSEFDDDDGAMIMSTNNGDNWKENGACQRVEYWVVLDAIDLLSDIKKTIDHQQKLSSHD